MTSCWSKGRSKLYPYYSCDTPDCTSRRKSIPRAQIEGGAENVLRALQPAKQVYALAKAMFTDIWQMRLAEAHQDRDALAGQIKETDSQIEALLNRIVEARNGSVISAYEARIE